jgi:hypothetical protein
MATFAATMAALAVLLILPLVVLLWATESPQQRARRWRAAGQSCKAIGARLGVTHQQVSAWCRA